MRILVWFRLLLYHHHHPMFVSSSVVCVVFDVLDPVSIVDISPVTVVVSFHTFPSPNVLLLLPLLSVVDWIVILFVIPFFLIYLSHFRFLISVFSALISPNFPNLSWPSCQNIPLCASFFYHSNTQITSSKVLHAKLNMRHNILSFHFGCDLLSK